jgi:hypothetical protein
MIDSITFSICINCHEDSICISSVYVFSNVIKVCDTIEPVYMPAKMSVLRARQAKAVSVR